MASNKQFLEIVESLLTDKNLHSDDHISINDKNKIVGDVKLVELFVLFCIKYFQSVLIIP